MSPQSSLSNKGLYQVYTSQDEAFLSIVQYSPISSQGQALPYNALVNTNLESSIIHCIDPSAYADKTKKVRNEMISLFTH